MAFFLGGIRFASTLKGQAQKPPVDTGKVGVGHWEHLLLGFSFSSSALWSGAVGLHHSLHLIVSHPQVGKSGHVCSSCSSSIFFLVA